MVQLPEAAWGRVAMGAVGSIADASPTPGRVHLYMCSRRSKPDTVVDLFAGSHPINPDCPMSWWHPGGVPGVMSRGVAAVPMRVAAIQFRPWRNLAQQEA